MPPQVYLLVLPPKPKGLTLQFLDLKQFGALSDTFGSLFIQGINKLTKLLFCGKAGSAIINLSTQSVLMLKGMAIALLLKTLATCARYPGASCWLGRGDH